MLVWCGQSGNGGGGGVNKRVKLQLRESGGVGVMRGVRCCEVWGGGGSACQLAGHQRGFPLGEVLGGGDVVPCDLCLLRSCCWQLLVLYLGFSHVVVARVKVFLLRRERKIKK